jgi:hypothetical protein
MSFQYLVNTASNISIDNRPTVAQTIARSGMIRSVNRGNAVWRFTVTPATGPFYSDLKTKILDAQQTGKDTEFNLQFNHTGLDDLLNYTGDWTSTTTRTVTVDPTTYGYNRVIDSTALPSGTYKYKKGDIIEVLGHVYQVTADVTDTGGADSVYLHRNLILADDFTAGSKTATLGTAATFTVKCINFPAFTLFGAKQVQWDGDFVFQEVVSS